MGDQQRTGAAAGQHTGKLTSQAQAHLHIEIGERLIEQHHRRPRGQGPGQGQPLALPAREFMGVAVLQPAEPEQLQQPGRPASVSLGSKSEAGVRPGIEMGEEGVVLKHHPHATPLRGQEATGSRHAASIQLDLAALRRLEAGDQAQQGGLAASGGPQQPHQFTGPQGQVQILQGPCGGAGEAMPDPTQLHPRARCSGGARRQARGRLRSRFAVACGRNGVCECDRKPP